MGTIKRREFLKCAALACPLLAAGGETLLRAQQKKNDDDDLMVVKFRCTGCGDCVKICPVEAITMKDGRAVIDVKECIDCAACITECPAEAIMTKKEYSKADKDAGKGGGKKADPAKPDDRPSVFDVKFDNAGVWIMTGTFTDGSTSSEPIRFDGTAAAGVIKSTQSNEEQGSYKVIGAQIEIRLPEGQIAKGRIVSADRLEGTLPGGAGKWRAEKKK
jgi:Fe-S-cluster-containing hydrogenase component 2